MVWSFPAGRVAGTAVRIHVTLFLLFGWFAVDAYLRSGLAAAARELVFVAAVFGCVLAHEFGHVTVARMFGIATPDITLYPFGGIARLNTIPQQPLPEFLVAIAGPLVNVLIAAALLAAGASLTHDALLHDHADLASRLATTNVVLAVFNLLPAFPMDGGRVLRALLSAFVGFERATRLAAVVGHWLAILFALLGIFVNPMLIVIGIVILLAATAELQALTVRSLARDRPVTRAMMTDFATLPMTATLADAAEKFVRTSQTVIPIVGDDLRFAGIMQIGDVVRELHARPDRSRLVADMARLDIPKLSRLATLEEAFRLLQEKSVPAVAVVDEKARLEGLVTLETLSEMIMLYEASPSVLDAASPSRDVRNEIHGDPAAQTARPRDVVVSQS